MPKGWKREPARHSLAAKGVKTRTTKLQTSHIAMDSTPVRAVSPFENFKDAMFRLVNSSSALDREVQFTLYYDSKSKIKPYKVAIGEEDYIEPAEPKTEVWGGFHTHPNGPPIPSEQDIAHAIFSGYKEFCIGGLALRFDPRKEGEQLVGWGKGGVPVVNCYKVTEDIRWQNQWYDAYLKGTADLYELRNGKHIYARIASWEEGDGKTRMA